MNFFLFFFTSHLLASTVSVPSTHTPAVEFQRYLESHPGKLSFSEHYLSQQNPTHLIDHDLKVAQFEFLQGSLKKAKKHFSLVFAQQHLRHWNKTNREKIHYAFLRAAQLEKNEKAKNDYLKRALTFDHEIIPNKSLFPPPLLDSYNSMKEEFSEKIWALPEDSQKYEMLLINGKKLDPMPDFLRVPPGHRKITFLSNRLQAFEVMVDMKNLSSLKLPMVPLAKGNCQNPQFSSRSLDQGLQLEIYDKGCQGKNNPGSMELARLGNSQKERKNTSPSVLRNKWLWIGVSIVATGFAINEINRQNSSSGETPTPSPPKPVVYSN